MEGVVPLTTRINAEREQSLASQLRGQLLREQEVGRLGLCVCRKGAVRLAVTKVQVIEPYPRRPAAGRSDVQDTGPGRRGEKGRRQEVRKEEVADMVDAQVRLDALGCGGVGGKHHDASIVDEHVDDRSQIPELSGSRTYGLLAGQVELQGLDVYVWRGCGSDGVDDLGDVGETARGEHKEFRAVLGHDAGKLGTQAVGGDAGDYNLGQMLLGVMATGVLRKAYLSCRPSARGTCWQCRRPQKRRPCCLQGPGWR